MRKGTKEPIDRTATTAPLKEERASGAGSAFASPLTNESELLHRPITRLVDSPYGERYISDLARPILADEVQVVAQVWDFDIRGYHGLQDPDAGPTLPDHLYELEELFSNWYKQSRDIGQVALKYKHLPLELETGGELVFREYLNLYVKTVANMVTLFTIPKLIQFNEAFMQLDQHLPTQRSKLSRLWRRLSTIFVPAGVQTRALLLGMVPYLDHKFPVHLRHFKYEAGSDYYGGGSGYTNSTDGTLLTILRNSSYLSEFVANIEKAIWFLEGYINDATMKANWIYITDLIRMIRDVPAHPQNQLWVQGLPLDNVFSVGPFINILDEYYLSGICNHDTMGLGDDQWNAFPVYGMTEARSLIPIRRMMPSPMKDDFNLFGAPKFYLVDDTPNLRYADENAEIVVFGTQWPVGANCTEFGIYTREDQFLNVTGVVDYGDGADIRSLINSKNPILRHIYWNHLFASQLTDSMEFSFVEQELRSSWHYWANPDELIDHHIQEIATMLGIPYSGGIMMSTSGGQASGAGEEDRHTVAAPGG